MYLQKTTHKSLQIAEAEAEAQENHKYLSILQARFQPLYHGSLLDVIEALPAIADGILIMHSVTRCGPCLLSCRSFGLRHIQECTTGTMATLRTWAAFWERWRYRWW